MNRPIISDQVLSYLRTNLIETDNQKLIDLRKEAQMKGIPIIPLETASFLRFLIVIKRPKKILEVGTAIGYSSLLMEIENPEDSEIITFERNPVMYEKAVENIKNFNLSNKISIEFGDVAKQYDSFKENEFDLIFLDGAKAKYLEQFVHLIKNLKNDGIILIDDIFQGGDILKSIDEIKHRNKGIHRHINQLLSEILEQKKYISSIVPLGDGLLMVQKNKKFNK
ncbi:hypothetical protein KIMC2_08010 [Xylocopilactobacillus apis]|uniref:Ho5U methyltransferase n=2 Tax=Xylocopilactobacillus apis TaxID=2932183 RepID=A0AAU9DL11_9LACO|nr:hypothetical protein KIMC2_08010 [Xylocopilactobacillus apis]